MGLDNSALSRWPQVREQTACPLCHAPKMPSVLLCIECFQKHKVGTAGIGNLTRFNPEIERRLTAINNNLHESADPFENFWNGITSDGWSPF